eukprot:1684286-Rhodomonas_salina.3
MACVPVKASKDFGCGLASHWLRVLARLSQGLRVACERVRCAAAACKRERCLEASHRWRVLACVSVVAVRASGHGFGIRV